MNTSDAKEYLSKREIPRLFESMLTGLMYHRPEDPLMFLESCLQKAREMGGPEFVPWDAFITPDRRPLPPIGPGQGKKVTFRPEPGPAPGLGPYRRYERLPPIQAQYSIESDSDMTESSGLIQEYDVFDPSKPRPNIIFVIGGPGSGKGTQTAKMADHYGYERVVVGEILRNQLLHHAPSDRKWELIAQIIANGELAPQETTIEELKHQFIKTQGSQGFIVDGFPREISQAFTFEEQIGSPDLVVLLACSNQQLRQRLEKRAAQQGRPDDNAHAIERRLETFKQNIGLIAKYYQERALIVRIDADRDEDDIFRDISAVVNDRLFPKVLQAEGFSEQAFSPEYLEGAGASCLKGELGGRLFKQQIAMADLKKKKIIYIMGGPGAGKGTQCKRLAPKYNLCHLSTGDLLRDEIATGSKRGKELAAIMERGERVSVDVVLELLGPAMRERAEHFNGFLIDGYPRSVEQAKAFEKEIAKPSFMLFFDVKEENLLKRLLNRAKTSNRADDKEETIRERVASFAQKAVPILGYFEERNILYRVIGDGTKDEVFALAVKVMDPQL